MDTLLKALASVSMLVAPIDATGQEAKPEFQPTVYGSVGFWTVVKRESDCVMFKTFVDDSYLVISFNSRINKSVIRFTDKSVKALKDGDKRKLLPFFRDKAGRSDDLWGEQEFEATIVDGVTEFGAGFNGSDMLADIERNVTLSFFYKENILVKFGLEDSAAAIVKLRVCAKGQAQINPSDLFSE